MGVTFRVISCACYKDKKLKDRSEWCEFCKCRVCGTKNVSTSSSVSGGDNRGSRRQGVEGLQDISPDLVLLALLLLVVFAIFWWAGDYPSRHFSIVSYIAIAYAIRDICVWLGKQVTEIINENRNMSS